MEVEVMEVEVVEGITTTTTTMMTTTAAHHLTAEAEEVTATAEDMATEAISGVVATMV